MPGNHYKSIRMFQYADVRVHDYSTDIILQGTEATSVVILATYVRKT
jgi:hypothetical protein